MRKFDWKSNRGVLLEDSYQVFNNSNTFHLLDKKAALFGPIFSIMENNRFGSLLDCILSPPTHMMLALHQHRMDSSSEVISDQHASYLYINSPKRRATRAEMLRCGSILQMFSSGTSGVAFELSPRMFCFNGNYIANNQLEEMTIETETSIKNNI